MASGAQYAGTGERELRFVRVLSATVIRVGDMLFLDSGTAKPANSFTWTTNLATTRANFAAVFLGIAVQASANGETDDIQVDVGPQGSYICGCSLAVFEIGDMITPAQDGSNSLLSSNVIEKTATKAAAIGRVQRYVNPADVRVTVHFASAYNVSSGNSNALVGA